MANKTIPQLPLQTGITDNDLLAIVDSGETITSKVKVSTLLSGIVIPDGKFIDAGGLNSIVNNYYSSTDIGSGSEYSQLLGGSGNTITTDPNFSQIIGGFDNDISGNSTRPLNTILGSYSSNISSNLGGYGCTILGGHDHLLDRATESTIIGGNTNTVNDNNTWASAVIGGYSNYSSGGQGGIFVGRSNTQNGAMGVILGGESNVQQGSYSAILGGQSNTIGSSNCRGVAIAGGNGNNMTNEDWSIVAGASNTIQNGERNAILGGTNNTIDEGVYNGMLAGQGNVMTFARVSAMVGSYGCTIRGDVRITPLGISNSETSFIRQTVGSGTAAFEGTQSSIYNSISSEIAGQVGNETYLATMIGSESSNISGGTNGTVMIGCSGRTGVNSYTTYVETLEAFDGVVLTDYANLDFASDGAAATGGVPLGGMYHNSGDMKIRIT